MNVTIVTSTNIINTFSLYYIDEYYTIPLELGKQTKNNYITVPPRCEKIFYVDTKMSEDCVIVWKELCQLYLLQGESLRHAQIKFVFKY